jgi:hypothetical protein
LVESGSIVHFHLLKTNEKVVIVVNFYNDINAENAYIEEAFKAPVPTSDWRVLAAWESAVRVVTNKPKYRFGDASKSVANAITNYRFGDGAKFVLKATGEAVRATGRVTRNLVGGPVEAVVNGVTGAEGEGRYKFGDVAQGVARAVTKNPEFNLGDATDAVTESACKGVDVVTDATGEIVKTGVNAAVNATKVMADATVEGAKVVGDATAKTAQVGASVAVGNGCWRRDVGHRSCRQDGWGCRGSSFSRNQSRCCCESVRGPKQNCLFFFCQFR